MLGFTNLVTLVLTVKCYEEHTAMKMFANKIPNQSEWLQIC